MPSSAPNTSRLGWVGRGRRTHLSSRHDNEAANRRLHRLGAKHGEQARSKGRIKWTQTPAPEFDFLTFEEADRLIAAAENEWRPMITVAVRSGRRLGELLALGWADIDRRGPRLCARAVGRGIIGTLNYSTDNLNACPNYPVRAA